MTMFSSWNVLMGSFPERRYLVMIPFSEETVQLINKSTIPCTVPYTFPSTQTHISGTHQHSSHDDRDQRQIDGDRTNRTVDEKLKDAGKYGHGTSEHLRDIRRRQ